MFPTLVVLITFGVVEIFSSQRLLFASLASSAFLIYADPQHGMNRVRVLVFAQLCAAAIGLFFYLVIGSAYISGGLAMILTILMMILLDVVHPPTVSTALSFAFRSGDASNLLIFGLSVVMIAG
jgi:CBS-domain-containing membrane protein